jgi:hypothetical protein
MKKTILVGIILSFSIILAGCGLVNQPAPTPTIMLPTLTPIVLPTFTPSPTATTAPVVMLSAAVNMENFALRAGPGRLFDRLEQYNEGATVNIIGRENSNNWVLVQTSDNRSGWMNLVGLDVSGPLNSLPIFEVNNAIILHGHVYLPGKLPRASAFRSPPRMLTTPPGMMCLTQMTPVSGVFTCPWIPKVHGL